MLVMNPDGRSPACTPGRPRHRRQQRGHTQPTIKPLPIMLTVLERERWMIDAAAELAENRLKNGLSLNLAEAAAVISSRLLEGAHDGRSAESLTANSRRVLTRDNVAPGVPETLKQLTVEASFPSGIRFVTVTWPIP